MDRAQRISSAIQSAGLSYTELAKRTGLSRSALQRYATGATTKVPLDAVKKIADACGVTPEYVMGWDVPENWQETKEKNGQIAKLTVRMRRDDDFLDVVTALNGLSAEQLGYFKGFLATIVPKKGNN